MLSENPLSEKSPERQSLQSNPETELNSILEKTEESIPVNKTGAENAELILQDIPPISPLATAPNKPAIWSFWPTIGYSALIFAIYGIMQNLAALFMLVIYLFNEHNQNSDLDIFKVIQSLTTNGLILSIATIVSASVGIAAIILFIKIKNGASISEYMGLNSFKGKTLLILIITGILLVIVSSSLDRFFPQSPNSNFTIEAYKSAGSPVLFGIAVVIFAPLFEEGFFRGFLFKGLSLSRLGYFWTIILTSLGWAILHIQYNVYGMITIFILGIFLGIVRLKTNSLWCAIIMHSLWNLAALVGTALYVNGIGT